MNTEALQTPRYPVIAIVANPDDDYIDTHLIDLDFVHSAYVRWLEASGALVVAIHIWDSDERIKEILQKSNGLLFQGGSNDLDLNKPFMKRCSFIFEEALRLNQNGIYYPIWGTCQGFEVLHILISKDNNTLTTANAWNISSPLIMDDDDFLESKIFSLLSDSEKEGLRTRKTNSRFHNFGISPEFYEKNAHLDRFFKITSLCEDLDGKILVNSVEAYDYPIYAVQHHPEKTNYVRNYISVPQCEESVSIGQKIANFLVLECRKNSNNFGESLKDYDLIDSYTSLPLFKEGHYLYMFSRDGKVI